MEPTRKAFVVYIDLDEVPGVMYSQESAQNVIRQVLQDRLSPYNPTVSLAPAAMQPMRSNDIFKM